MPRRLSNGLRVELISDPLASRASALLQVEVGSLHEPAGWPGLAHLLEHLLFADSRRFTGSERLMAWLPAQGGRLNATTHGSSTAFFFECAPALLDAALARLCDMLAAPLLAEESIRQEVATIDAEYQLLCSHQETLSDAALSAAFQPHPWQRLQVGHAGSFGSDPAPLRVALQQFHQQHYRAPRLTLWLQGPQPEAALWQLARQYGGVFNPEETAPFPLPALQFAPQRAVALQLSGAPRLRLSFLLDGVCHGPLTLLRQLLLDEAAGGLMADLLREDLADEVRLLLPYRSAAQTVVTIALTLVDEQQAARVEGRVHHWLQQLARLSPEQRQHYVRLAERQFFRQSPMDQLRDRAFGFAPPDEAERGFSALLAGMTPQRLSRLLICGQPLPQREVQGFPLHCHTSLLQPVPACGPPLRFYPQPACTRPLMLPDQQADLPHLPGGERPVLLLSPLTALPVPWGEILQASVRALAASCAHQHAALSVSCQQGLWLIELSASPAQMAPLLAELIVCLRSLPPQAIAQGQRGWQRQQQARREGIAVRALLAALPELLLATDNEPGATALPARPWQATLEGGDKALHQSLAQLLSTFPGAINPAVRALPEPTVPPRESLIATDSTDAALLLFCPLVENSARCLAAWQLLALIYQPAFFQRLRVEQNIGYVVSCRFQQLAGQPGILFALQSPTLSVAELWRCIDLFLQQMHDPLRAMTAAQLAETRRAVSEALAGGCGDAQEQSRERWQQRQSQAPALTATAIASIDIKQLGHYHQQLCQQRERWWRLSNQCSLFSPPDPL